MLIAISKRLRCTYSDKRQVSLTNEAKLRKNFIFTQFEKAQNCFLKEQFWKLDAQLKLNQFEEVVWDFMQILFYEVKTESFQTNLLKSYHRIVKKIVLEVKKVACSGKLFNKKKSFKNNFRPSFKERPECFLKSALFHFFKVCFWNKNLFGWESLFAMDFLFRKAQHKVPFDAGKALQFRGGRDKGWHNVSYNFFGAKISNFRHFEQFFHFFAIFRAWFCYSRQPSVSSAPEVRNPGHP